MSNATGRLPRGVLAPIVAIVLVLASSSTVVVAALTGGIGGHNGAFEAVACDAPSLPGAIVNVTESDMGSTMMGTGLMRPSLLVDPTSVSAGKISFVVHNEGNLVHEMLVMPLPRDGAGTRPTGSDGKIDESASLGEASQSCAAGRGDGIAPGATGWVTLDLVPGRYELICDQPWHYAAGMFDVLTVQGDT
jgi:uncharacterized cupredoxin-like copper-binding protein